MVLAIAVAVQATVKPHPFEVFRHSLSYLLNIRSMSLFQESWYVIYTKPRFEKKVEDHLVRNNIRCFLPVHDVLRQWHDRKKYVREPLFPSYLFVFPKNIKEYYTSVDAAGSLGYIKIGSQLAKVSESVIQSIMLVQSLGLELEVTDTYFSPGSLLKVSSGPLEGLECEFVSYKSKKMGLIRLVSQNLLITLPLKNLAVSGGLSSMIPGISAPS